MSESPGYVSYLLRLWQTWQGGRPVWRASLQSTSTDEQRGFPDLESLVAFLRARVERPQGGPAGPATDDRLHAMSLEAGQPGAADPEVGGRASAGGPKEIP
jgi:hypothetical protein